jgi:membrane-associated phospholipid phosphatase
MPQLSEPQPQYRRALLILVAGMTVLRLCLAPQLELIGDEGRGWLYARDAGPWRLDAPSLWGFLIWCSTLGGRVASELAVRLPAIGLSAATSLLLFRWVREWCGPAAGWYAALLFNTSFLFAAIGVVNLPDAPLLFFSLLAVYCLWKGLSDADASAGARRWILLSGVSLGLALLADARASLLLPGALAFLLIDRSRRAWLARPEPWIALGMAAVLFLPVLYWNYEHGWVAFTLADAHVASGLAAPVLLLNPVMFCCAVLGWTGMARGGAARTPASIFCTCLALPPLFFSALTARWHEPSSFAAIGVAGLAMLPIAGAWIARHGIAALMPRACRLAAAVFLIGLGAGLAQLELGLIDLGGARRGSDTATRGPSLPMSGWRALGAQLQSVVGDDRRAGEAQPSMLLAQRSSTLARLDFYAGSKLGLDPVCLADLEQPRGAAARRAAQRDGASGYLVVPHDPGSGPIECVAHEQPLASYDRFDGIDYPRVIEVEHGRSSPRSYLVDRFTAWHAPPEAEPSLSRPEYRLFFALNRSLPLVGYANWLGVGYISGPLALLVLWLLRRREQSPLGARDFAAIASASVICATLVRALKDICHRERPLRLFAAAIERGEVELHTMFASKYQHGFPSGHTATAFLIATLLVLTCPSRTVAWISYALALLVGISTISVGVHLPLDVLAGALVGTIAALWGDRFVGSWIRNGGRLSGRGPTA